MSKITKKQYEDYLNEVGLSLSDEKFIIGGKKRRMNYGAALRKYDPIAFEVGYSEYVRESDFKNTTICTK